MNLIDTHAHFYLPQFDEDIEQCVERAVNAGISRIILPNIDYASILPMRKLCAQFPDIFIPLIGLHPTHVKENFNEELKLILAELEKGKHAGIGETGIDLYWDKTFFEEQKEAFLVQLNYSLKHNLPIVIHARESYTEIIEVLKTVNSPVFKGIFHAFSGTPGQADEAIEMGFHIGIGGVLTFKNSTLQKVVDRVDLNHIVLETDSPYLAPVPYRGKRNESSYMPFIVEKIAEITGKSVEEVAFVTTQNATKLFNL